MAAKTENLLTDQYETMESMDRSFPVIFHKDRLILSNAASKFRSHWHETIELLFFIQGEAVVKCNSAELRAKAGDLIVVNSNELHQGRCVTETAEYYCIIFDTSLFQSRRTDVCEAKYITPISENRILFENKVENDADVALCVGELIREYENRAIGYEMAVKAAIYRLLVLLLRKHVQKTLTSREYEARVKNLERFNRVLEYIESHFSEKITIDELCTMANISRFYFCRQFKNITGQTLDGYLNLLRVEKAEAMLRDRDVNITEAALACGFSDINYFSRVFRRYKKASPSSVVREKKIAAGIGL